MATNATISTTRILRSALPAPTTTAFAARTGCHDPRVFAVKIEQVNGGPTDVIGKHLTWTNARKLADAVRHTVRYNERLFVEGPNGFEVR
jgi:hypothetical protein